MFTLPNLPYAYSALEPHIDAQTMEIHHSKHHQAYINNLNAAIEGTPMAGKSIDALITEHADVPRSAQQRRWALEPQHVLDGHDPQWWG